MSISKPSRRSFFSTTASAAAAAGLYSTGTARVLAAAQPAEAKSSPVPAAPAIAPLNRFPCMVQEYFVRRVREIERAGNERRAALKTRADAERYVTEVREKILDSFGPFPEKTPLNAKTTGVLKRDGYRVEKVIFESRPQFFVTANLYVPEIGKGKMPGVVGTCGHSLNGKAEANYQSFAQGLARQGYVVLIFDPPGQGERLQYPNEQLKSRIGAGVAEHLYAGNQQFLVGQFLGSWRAWDGIRALDYLLSREEVDPNHIGVTGNSGGGTDTTWLCGVERRWTMAAPSCFVTTFRRNLENELAADTEQCPPRALAHGLDESDFLAAMAPNPVIVLSQERDFFDTRGSNEAYQRLKHLYALLGAGENVGFFAGPREHGYWIENRQAMYRWFNRFTGASAAEREPELKLEKDQDLWCTPRGQVADLKSRPVYSYTKELSENLAHQRMPLDEPALKDAVAAALKLPSRREGAPDYRILRPVHGRRFPGKGSGTYAVETEPGILALVYMLSGDDFVSRPPQVQPRAVLYVSDRSADAELRDEPLIREIQAADPDAVFYAADVRGIGESQPNSTSRENAFLLPYGSDYFYSVHSVMLDYPYVGQKTYDVLRLIDWMESNGHREIHLAARGRGAFAATFAALLSERVTQVTLKYPLSSYSEVAESETYALPLATFLPGVLKTFDLPDCYRALAKKKLRMIDPQGPNGTAAFKWT